MIIKTRAPVRLSFGGGGTDVSPYTEDHGGCVLSAAINKYAWSTLELRRDKEIHLKDSHSKEKAYNAYDDLRYGNKLDLLTAVVKDMNKRQKGLNLTLRGDVPPRSGLGSSASAFVSLIGAFNQLSRDRRLTDYEVAEKAYSLERFELGNRGGRQDQYASVFGGLNFIEFKGKDFVRVNPVRISRGNLLELEKNIVLVQVMDRQKSGDIIVDQMKSYVNGKKEVVEALHQVKVLAQEMNKSLRHGDLNRFGELLHQGWVQKKKFSPLISNREIDKIYSIARRNGAIGGKISGAGGGGHMIVYCDSGREENVVRAVTKAGGYVRSFSFDMEGLVTWEV
ncbi:MAG: GHMP kinase [Candidatus Altiarchaeota archaeon]|nr:GHMP kinase [Candidatus Altiarchaeota archaeon]